jgi:NAD(P)-dependent dehydrogenase (short-subunit alcohol dehydrogenase family)
LAASTSDAATLAQCEGRPGDIAHAVLFLAGKEFIAGACLPVDGGRAVDAAGHR